ncbi:FAD-binding and (Fe-S)-binding domain-containing protein [Alteromonas sp. ASW11-130]|uniref:FAD-binding and (Fe-S)-binding domain-containing protein n=1 Tax=Alteromonas sp. ASW11-130 TaxID=3015775 RepID=UPI002241E1A5|nr:FAD-binding and (Fe-S)-binding domain-containing protein [Alteromonas sp. ASW11-130]MCW8090843.1 FAD-binding oxidoreductase [Alteromonas sp. ASW11-130]
MADRTHNIAMVPLNSAKSLHQLPAAQRAAFDDAIDALLPPPQIIRDLARRLAFSTDASFYQLTPSLILHVATPQQMRQVISLAQKYAIALTFRAAGTSLSGQAVTDSVLIMLTPDWQIGKVLEDGLRIALQPGVIGARANRLLAPYGRKIGPDPASINACKVGGIAANNASGMCCGIKHNSYHTLSAMHLILADGSEVITDDPQSTRQFRASQAPLLAELKQLSDELQTDPPQCELIRHQFRLKNTMGYGINALLDFDDPLDMLTHLMIGSEGTLGFIANITYHTIPIPAHRSVALYLFPSLTQACALPARLQALSVNAVELMDTRALRAVQHLLTSFTVKPIADGEVALLIEIGADCDNSLAVNKKAIEGLLEATAVARPICEFTSEIDTIERLWAIRKGLFPAVGAVRKTGTTVIIEDVALPLAQLAEGLNDLNNLFEEHNYPEAIIFGHALDGNVHFVFTQRFDTQAEVLRYQAMMDAVVELITIKYDGTLKAEHGTGRNMAPFLSNQWGQQSVNLMRKIKFLLDPSGIFNPGVILNDNPNAHLTHLKALPQVDDKVDACIECGFCEPSCPSKNLTLTPRQRIALMRRATHLEVGEKQQVEKAFQYLGVDSCAATGMCASACPVDIDTGDWVRDLRRRRNTNAWFGRLSMHHFPVVTQAVRTSLSLARSVSNIISPAKLEKVSRKMNRFTGKRIPVWLDTTPSGASSKHCQSVQFDEKVIYLPSCPTRVFAANKQQLPLQYVVTSLLNKAGIQVIIPEDSDNLCCGQPWQSKGYAELADKKNNQTSQSIHHLNSGKEYPVLTDASSCALQFKLSGQSYWELSAFLLEHVVPKLQIVPLNETVLLHTTCSTKRNKQADMLRQLTQLCVDRIIEVDEISCCGFAGEKGFWLPELNESALAPIKETDIASCRRGVSNNRSCEIGLSRYSGIEFSHVAYLLDEVSK